jgi:hypothetical protein
VPGVGDRDVEVDTVASESFEVVSQRASPTFHVTSKACALHRRPQSAIRRSDGRQPQWASHLKLAVDDPHDGAFRVFETIQIVSLGIEGKIALWRSLAGIADVESALGGLDFEALIARGVAQRFAIEPLHLAAARGALLRGK